MSTELENYKKTISNENFMKTLECIVHTSIEEQLKAEQSQSITALSKALSKAQAELTSVTANYVGQSGFQKYKYAKYHDVVELISLVLPKHGLSYSHQIIYTPRILVVCKLMHENEWLRSTLPVDLFLMHPQYFNREAHKINIMQDLGSSISYGKRYTLTSIVGIAVTEEDDDAQSLGLENSAKNAITPKRVLFNLCKNNGIDPKEFGEFSKVSNGNVETISAVIRDFVRLKEEFLTSKMSMSNE